VKSQPDVGSVFTVVLPDPSDAGTAQDSVPGTLPTPAPVYAGGA
jgi:hypothetical protein